MSSYGVTDEGFVDKPLEDILTELETEQKANIDPGFDVSAQSPAGQINGIFASKLRELWEVAQAAYNSVDPDSAIGQALTRLSLISGTVKEAATKSTVTATVNLNAGVTLAAGAVASVSGNPTARFVTTEAVTNGGGAPADVSVAMEAQTAGAVVANTGTLTVIETPQSGWNSVTNAADATIGEAAETDTELRSRRETEVRAGGSTKLSAIESAVAAVTGVTKVRGFENVDNITDADGVPPHSFQIVALGGDADEIAQAIWDTGAGGIEAHGSSSGNAIDANGATQVVAFDRPTERTIYMDVFLTVNTDPLLGAVYPGDGDDQVKAALAALVQTFDIGDDLILSALYPSILAIDGVLDVTSIEADFSASPSATSNLTIGSRELADLDTANITVTT